MFYAFLVTSKIIRYVNVKKQGTKKTETLFFLIVYMIYVDIIIIMFLLILFLYDVYCKIRFPIVLFKH